MSIDSSQEVSHSAGWFKRFFVNYFWLGVVITLLAVILDLQYPEKSRSEFGTIIIKLFETIGVSVLVAAVFTYASSTNEFIGSIRKLLEDIIVKRNFLANIDPVGKKEALKALIQPSAAEMNKYPNIGDYYGYFIEKTLAIQAKSVRSNYQIMARAFFDESKRRVAVEGVYCYRLYPSAEGFSDITLGFEEGVDGVSFCSHVIVTCPDGERHSVQMPELKEHNEGGDISRRFTFPIREFGSGKNHLDVEFKVTEYGGSGGMLMQFKALQPTDGFRFELRCDASLAIARQAIFVVGAKYYLNVAEDRKTVSVNCNQWINEGSGLCVLVLFDRAQDPGPMSQNG